MSYYVAEHVMVNPLHMKDNVASGRGWDESERLKVWGEHMTRWWCVWTRMGFCAAGNLNALNSTYYSGLGRKQMTIDFAMHLAAADLHLRLFLW